jgi:hypothetical protein
VRLAVGSTVNRHGKAMTIRLQGEVEPYFRDAPESGGPEPSGGSESPDQEPGDVEA